MNLVIFHILWLIMLLSQSISHAQNGEWTLQQCIDTARVNNKNMQIKRNNLVLNEQRAKEAKANLNPKINANADYKYYTNLPYQLLPLSALNPLAPEGEFRAAQFGVPHNINANIQFTMPLYSPQLYGAIHASKIASEISVLEIIKAEELIYLEISNLYYNAQIMHHQLDFIDSNLINTNRILKNTQLLKEQLLATISEVNKIELQISQLTTQKIQIESKYKQVLNALKFHMGIPASSTFIIDNELNFDEYIEYVREDLIDYKLLTQQSILHQIELKYLYKSTYLPTIGLLATLGTSGFGYDQPPQNFLDFYPYGFAGLQVSYPIFNGNTKKYKIEQKKLDIINNELMTALNNEQTTMQIENANLQIRVARSSINTTLEQIQLAKSIYEKTILKQKNGLATLTDVLLEDKALRESQQAYLSAIVVYLQADLELKRTTGQITSTN